MEKNEHPEEIIQYSPYRQPKEKYGEGKWVVVERHVDKNYPLRWRWVPKINLNSPPEEPPNENLLTRAEKMERDFEAAGYPTKGSQPATDFEPDETEST